MKLIRVKLVCLAFVMTVAYAEGTTESSGLRERRLQYIRCGSIMDNMLMLLCATYKNDDADLPPLLEAFPSSSPSSTSAKLHKGTSWTNVLPNPSSECCLKPCSITEMLKFC